MLLTSEQPGMNSSPCWFGELLLEKRIHEEEKHRMILFFFMTDFFSVSLLKFTKLQIDLFGPINPFYSHLK